MKKRSPGSVRASLKRRERMERLGPVPPPPLPFLIEAAHEFEDANPDPDSVARWWVYVLALETGRYYVGKTSSLRVRMSQHSACKTKLTTDYRPIRLARAFRVEEELAGSMESEITNQYLEEFGIHGVRGGHYCHAWDQVVHLTSLKPRPSWIPAPASWTLLQRD